MLGVWGIGEGCGMTDLEPKKFCALCEGWGEIPTNSEYRGSNKYREEICPKCKGTGWEKKDQDG